MRVVMKWRFKVFRGVGVVYIVLYHALYNSFNS